MVKIKIQVFKTTKELLFSLPLTDEKKLFPVRYMMQRSAAIHARQPQTNTNSQRHMMGPEKTAKLKGKLDQLTTSLHASLSESPREALYTSTRGCHRTTQEFTSSYYLCLSHLLSWNGSRETRANARWQEPSSARGNVFGSLESSF